MSLVYDVYFFFSSRRRHTRCSRDWSSDVCSSDLSCHGSARLLVIGEELLETADIAVVHETRAAGARLAFDLAVLVAEIVATVGRVALEALRRLAKALGRGPVGFQLGHRSTPGCVARSLAARAAAAGERSTGLAARVSVTSFSVQTP